MDIGKVAHGALDYLIYVLPQIVGAIVGVIIGGIIVQRYWVRKANEAALIEYLITELTDLVDETLDYWSLDCTGTGSGAADNRRQVV